MRLKHFFSLLLFGLFAFKALAQCPPGQNAVRLEINTDSYYYEESWVLTSVDGSVIYGSGAPADSATHNFVYCVPAGQCVNFTITDTGFDGFFPDGFYRLYVNDTLIFERINSSFGHSETITLNCPPGTSCVSPIYLTPGMMGQTPSNEEAWYSFTPDETGTYVFATCGAACPTKIWVYDRCLDIFISEIQLGTIFYTTDGCPDSSASARLNLQAGKEYFIRVRYETVGCSTESIPFSFTSLGPVVGCTDSTACNFEPLATVSSGVCIYPGDPDCDKAPDFEVNQEFMRSTLQFDNMEAPTTCEVEEGCLRGMGNRYIIRFATQIKNVGDADFYIGKAPDDPSEPSTQFVYDPCHHHWHYMGYAEYILYDAEGNRIAIGSKTGFCVFDGECYGVDKKYVCTDMGISASCGDIYGINTPCQWIDITDIPPGKYTMVVRVNWDKSPDKLGRVEKRFDNNWAQACFTLSYDNGTPDVVFNADSCQQFTDCLGEVFGNALPDCNGVCNGPALIGDLNQDTLRNAADVAAYLNASLAANGAATPCSELHEDGQINVFDAALLQECNIYADSQQHWIQRFPCQFPTGFQNTQDVVTIQPGALDTLAKTFEIEMANPLNRIMGYEFSISGMVIESIENLAPEHQVVPQFNSTSGKILALAADESGIYKNFAPTPFLRVHYSSLSDTIVCVSDITAVVNNKYQKSMAVLGIPNCVLTHTVGTGEAVSGPFGVFVQPNPMRENTTVFFENKNAEPMNFVLTDLTGRRLRTFADLRGESLTISREDLPEGTYFFTLQCSRGSVSGKIMVQ